VETNGAELLQKLETLEGWKELELDAEYLTDNDMKKWTMPNDHRFDYIRTEGIIHKTPAEIHEFARHLENMVKWKYFFTKGKVIEEFSPDFFISHSLIKMEWPEFPRDYIYATAYTHKPDGEILHM